MGAKMHFVYILTNHLRTVLYIGMTDDLSRRVTDHKNRVGSVFASKYQCADLIYAESFVDEHSAIVRERQLKGWRRSKKIRLIAQQNPLWKDMAEEWCI
jgi:putative endonuclease